MSAVSNDNVAVAATKTVTCTEACMGETHKATRQVPEGHVNVYGGHGRTYTDRWVSPEEAVRLLGAWPYLKCKEYSAFGRKHSQG